MHTKIVENWLTNVGELTFTIPFCQLLLTKGYRVVHISSQGPMEQGKDVIAVDKNGRVHCYQLKSGNINNKVWGEIKSEIDDLVELPPKHPSLPAKVEEWDAYLVTNGTFANPVARTIHDYAEAKKDRGHRPLKTIVRDELVQDFTEHFGDFMPVEIQDLQRFLDLYNDDGEHDLPCEKFKRYFESFFASHSTGSRQRKTEAIRAALILCTYLLTYKYVAGNRIEIIKAYALLLASIYHYAESNGLDDRLWRETEQLVYEAIEIEFRQLVDELAEHPTGFVESKYGVLSETIVYKLRCNEILGYLAAYLNYCSLRGIEPYQPTIAMAALNKVKDSIALVGECAIPFLTNYGLNAYAKGDAQEAALTWVGTLVGILKANSEGTLGLPSPYYSMPQAVELALGIDGKRTGESFRFRSFCLRSIILLLARTGQRNVLSTAWSSISLISQSEVIPDTRADYLMWKIPSGPQSDRFADTPQSWAKLVAESTAYYADDLPLVLRARSYFLPFLINAMPQRFNHRVVMALFTALDKPKLAA
jgi:hypothetical protein